ncbi:hypothetical protein QYF61_004143 [Mycteria americana]|uniref:Ly6/PLAUR domain-containing protein 6B n=2 Tax=Mycteria americana TaxID=33587 RepID=A0AAN7RU67_MYCAM|nr:hypothetical protein QYF61_004143 [Mycteria americana]
MGPNGTKIMKKFKWYLSWFKPSRQLSPPQLLTHSPPEWLKHLNLRIVTPDCEGEQEEYREAMNDTKKHRQLGVRAKSSATEEIGLSFPVLYYSAAGWGSTRTLLENCVCRRAEFTYSWIYVPTRKKKTQTNPQGSEIITRSKEVKADVSEFTPDISVGEKSTLFRFMNSAEWGDKRDERKNEGLCRVRPDVSSFRVWTPVTEFCFSCTIILSMLLFYHMLAGAFLPFLILSGNWVSAENINFYNVRPPLDPTPFPNSFKCFTCDNAVDNYNCNRWAEDRWCPESTQYCLTVHLFTDHGKSTSVTKKCATGEECHFVGCHHHRESGHTECVSCCEGMICNVEIPTNHTNAIFAVLHARRTSDGSRRTGSIAVLVSVVMIALSQRDQLLALGNLSCNGTEGRFCCSFSSGMC